MLEVVNPLHREPENMDTVAYKCSCVCHIGSAHEGSRFWASLPITGDCGCNCYDGNDANDNANFSLASAYS